MIIMNIILNCLGRLGRKSGTNNYYIHRTGTKWTDGHGHALVYDMIIDLYLKCIDAFVYTI